jgi:NAD(P)H-dependent FMN reductase
MRVLAISGSLPAKSSNTALMRRAVALSNHDTDVVLFEGLAALPHFNTDLERDGTLATVDSLRAAVAAADGLLIACPEYGFSLPGVLKNAVDWLIGSAELERKLVAITAATVGHDRGLRGLAALHQTLSAVSAEVVFDAPITRDEDADGRLREVLAALEQRHRARAPA